MRKSVTNIYQIDDVKKMVKEVLREEKVTTTDDLVSLKNAILHELQGIRENQELITGYKDQIEDHDLRIGHIEKHLHLAQPE